MSGHGHHDAGAEPHAGHDDHHPETSSDDFPADEPRSPGWLPLLGGALFLAGIFAFVVFGADPEPAAGGTPAVVASAPAPQGAAANPANRPARPARPSLAPPGARDAIALPAR